MPGGNAMTIGGSLKVEIGCGFINEVIVSKTMNKTCILIFLLLGLIGSEPVFAQDAGIQATLDRLEKLVQQQQQELEAQRKELATQKKLIEQLQTSQTRQEKSANEGEDVFAQKQVPTAPTADSTPPEAKSGAVSEAVAQGSKADSKPVAVSEKQIVQSEGTFTPSDQRVDPSNTIYDKDFPGAWQLPGTDAAMKIGGYVNLSLVNSFNPLLITDRFITGSIPVDGSSVDGAKSGTDVTANQTRINMEVREQTAGGQLRAFIEGDFEGDNTTFRLRHAFGQYRWALAGKTWSTLMDVDSRPEEVDFEGINGQILARQPQVRFFPKFGQNTRLKLAVENPQTDVIDGTGGQSRSDFVLSVDRLPLGSFGSWNSRVGFIYRDLEATPNTPGTGTPKPGASASSTAGYGVTTSGKKSLARLGEQDFLLWQLTWGKGIGRYINDLNTIGGGDAVFDPEDKLRALPIFAGYVSYQHSWPKALWFFKDWPGQLRSNFTASWVTINNYEYQNDADYHQTLRASANLMYQPTLNARFGIELLWGRRSNKDGTSGTASQLQISGKYDF